MQIKELENLFYEYGETMKQIGKCETNEKIGMKEYNKLINEKEKLISKFEELVDAKPNKKLQNTLGIV